MNGVAQKIVVVTGSLGVGVDLRSAPSTLAASLRWRDAGAKLQVPSNHLVTTHFLELDPVWDIVVVPARAAHFILRLCRGDTRLGLRWIETGTVLAKLIVEGRDFSDKRSERHVKRAWLRSVTLFARLGSQCSYSGSLVKSIKGIVVCPAHIHECSRQSDVCWTHLSASHFTMRPRIALREAARVGLLSYGNQSRHSAEISFEAVVITRVGHHFMRVFEMQFRKALYEVTMAALSTFSSTIKLKAQAVQMHPHTHIHSRLKSHRYWYRLNV